MATPPTLSLPPVAGDEGSAFPLAIGVAGLDRGTPEAVAVTLTGVPADATLSAGTRNPDGSYTLSPAQLPGLTLLSPHENQFTLGVAATAAVGATGATATATGTQAVTARVVPPTLTLSGPAQANQGRTYTVTVGAAEAGTDVVRGWVIAWGEGRTPAPRVAS